jgi:diguanylate cyclase (GGDEF)-like protein
VADRRKKDDLREAITRLEEVIAQHVRREQQLDQLTQLPNGIALTEALGDAVASTSSSFWVAFVEIDKFKSLNDRFGHEGADVVLQQVADLMRAMQGGFAGKTVAYRAHGDEFYYLGRGPEEDVAVALEALRQTVDAIRVEAESGVMKCTVSIGWLTKGDIAPRGDEVITVRRVHDALELAVARAKRTRNALVRFSAALRQEDWISQRADCSACDCRFTLDLKRAAARPERLSCPNCGNRVDRPAAPPPRPSGPVHQI